MAYTLQDYIAAHNPEIIDFAENNPVTQFIELMTILEAAFRQSIEAHAAELAQPQTYFFDVPEGALLQFEGVEFEKRQEDGNVAFSAKCSGLRLSSANIERASEAMKEQAIDDLIAERLSHEEDPEKKRQILDSKRQIKNGTSSPGPYILSRWQHYKLGAFLSTFLTEQQCFDMQSDLSVSSLSGNFYDGYAGQNIEGNLNIPDLTAAVDCAREYAREHGLQIPDMNRLIEDALVAATQQEAEQRVTNGQKRAGTA